VPKSPAAHRPRRVAVYALLAIATITCFFAVFAVWVQRQALDTDNWVRSSSELLDDPAVRSTVATYLVDQLYANVDVTGELREALPEQFKGLAGPAAGAVRNFADDAADKALQRPRVQELWATVNRRAHTRLMQVLEGGGPIVSTAGGTVTLDLGALLQQVAASTGIGGRLADRVPPDAASVEVLHSDQLDTAQRVVNALRPLAIVLTALALALFALAVWLARGWRREALRASGAGLVLAGVAALIARRIAGDEVVAALAPTAAVQPAAESVWRIETTLLVAAAQAVIAYGVVIVLGTWLAGPTRAATAVRRALAPYLARPGYAYAGVALVVLLLIAWGPTQALRQATTAILLIALFVAGFEVLRRQVVREHPGAADMPLGLHLRRVLSRRRPATTRPPAGDGAAAPTDPITQMERVAALHERGALTDEEFEAQKRALLPVP